MIEKDNKPLEIAVRSTMSLQSKRIFIDAKNADGGVIGVYKGGEIYVNPTKEPYNRLPNKGTKGKSGKDTFANGEKHKTGYFANYLSYKKEIGRNKNTLNVNLFLTGDLHRNWANSEVVGKANASRVNQHNYVVGLSEENYNKVKPYGRVFNLSIKERSAFLLVIKDELKKILKSA